MTKPKISIVIPTYNRADLIAESLESILGQTFDSWECIIIDDNSNDNTIEIVTPFLKDKRFKFTTKPLGYAKGANASRNYGLELSQGKYIYWLDSDDIIHPLTFELCINEFSWNIIDFCRFQRTVFFDNFDVKCFDNYNIDENVFFIDKSHIEKIINNELPINTCSVIWKKKSLGFEKFSNELLYAEEWEYYSRLVSNGLKGININKVLIYARKHSCSQTHEFNCNNYIRVEAKKEAALLIVKNLAAKKMLTYSLKRYFICLSIGFKEYNLFEQIISTIQISSVEKIKWQIFYTILPLRLSLYKIKKAIKM
ncbi:glycosyltransferase family 2 protein [Flavobacterium sp. LB3P122]|uniref:glycosyltransferase family 2 protein n=1 Tax=Flavobacterium algoriphilum TaxID=3398738 RepID=UPI003A89A07B